jgi:hypothetical protein
MRVIWDGRKERHITTLRVPPMALTQHQSGVST